MLRVRRTLNFQDRNFIAYEIDRHLGAHYATQRLIIVVYTAMKTSDLTFSSQIACVYETFRSFILLLTDGLF